MTGQTIAPCLWFETEALEAAEFYASVFPNSAVVSVQKAPVDTPGAKAGSVLLVQFRLAGQDYQALNGGSFYDHYRTRDGRWFSVGSLEPAFMQAFCAALGRPELASRGLSPALESWCCM